MLQLFRHERVLPQARDLQRTYDVVIIGAGVHGLATAYYLGKVYGITNVAVLEKSYLGAGNSGRNTAILRANYRTPEGIPFFAASLELYEQLSQELGWNVLFSQCGHLTLAHNDSAVAGLRLRAETNNLFDVENRVIDREELQQLVPALDCSDHARYPIQAALYNPPGGIIRHDAVVWGYARACERMGIEIHPFTEATAINVNGSTQQAQPHGNVPSPVRQHGGGLEPAPGSNRGWGPADGSTSGSITGVTTNRGEIATPAVVNCTAGWATVVANMAGVPLPIVTQPLQACVTEPLKPFLDKVIVSANLHVYINQTDRGELGHRRGGRPLSVLQHGRHTAHAGADGQLYPGAIPAAAQRQSAPAVGRHLRHDPRLLAHHRRRRGLGRLLPGCRLGYLRLQGRADCRQVPRRANRHRPDPGPDRAVHPLPMAFRDGLRLVGEKAAAVVLRLTLISRGRVVGATLVVALVPPHSGSSGISTSGWPRTYTWPLAWTSGLSGNDGFTCPQAAGPRCGSGVGQHRPAGCDRQARHLCRIGVPEYWRFDPTGHADRPLAGEQLVASRLR